MQAEFFEKCVFFRSPDLKRHQGSFSTSLAAMMISKSSHMVPEAAIPVRAMTGQDSLESAF